MKAKQQNVKKERNVLPGIILAALFVSIVVYVVMMNVEQNLLADFDKKNVFVATKEIPKGQLINEKNQTEYLVEKELDASLVSSSMLLAVDDINDFVARYDIDNGTIVSQSMFEELNQITENMKDPVIAGLKADDMFQLVGGTLRAGDRIHLYSLDEDGKMILKWPDIFVQQVFDQSGVIIPNSDTQTVAQRINIYIDKSNIEELYGNFSSGNLRAVKVLK